ncbi:MAG: LysM peptidoglycan-binding domain-containing protein [Anaerolineae bacterium]
MTLLVVGLVGILVVMSDAMSRGVHAQEAGPNLLQNGDFEQGAGEAWPFQDGIMEVQVAPGWRAFWADAPPPGTQVPNYCDPDDHGCYWARPEFRGMSTAEFAYRVHGGMLSQKYFTYNRQHEAGIYQTVSGIEPGTRLRFQIYAETWSCLGAEGNPLSCPTGANSNRPAPMHTRVGIDPTGGTNPWAPSVVWSQEFETYDTWTPFWVEANAEASTVTVFFYSRVDWTEGWPRVNNDVYLDDATLRVVGDVTPTAPPPPPTSEVPPTPNATSTPRPDGAVVHIVQPGDTLLGIAFQYGVDLDELRRLNAGTLGPNDLLSVGQEIIISGEPIALPSPSPTPTSEAEPITEPTVEGGTVAPGDTPVVTEGTAICIVAFNDRNGDMVYQSGEEELIPNATITLVGVDGPAGTYTTDGLSEPYCFQGLEPGNYVVRRDTPAGYTLSGPSEWGVLVNEGQSFSLQLGYLREGNPDTATADPTAEEPAEETSTTDEEGEEGESSGDLLRTIIRVSGIAALVLALAVAGLFVLSRRNP